LIRIESISWLVWIYFENRDIIGHSNIDKCFGECMLIGWIMDFYYGKTIHIELEDIKLKIK
jgi:hypothetical protein